MLTPAAPIRRLEPDLFVGAGDHVYYDHPATTAAKTSLLPTWERLLRSHS